MPRMVVRSLAWGLVIGVTACASEPLTPPVPEAESPTIEANPLRNTYFGDLHIHTKYSFDAFIFNTRTTPDDAYRYAKGEAIQHGAGFPIQLQSGPLDFYAVTDHAMFLGILPAMVDPTTAISRQDIAQSIANASTVDELRSAFLGMFSMLQEGFLMIQRCSTRTSSGRRGRTSWPPPSVTMTPADSRRLSPSNTPPDRNHKTCTATSSSAAARRRTSHSAESIRRTWSGSGTGWINSGPPGGSCCRFRTT